MSENRPVLWFPSRWTRVLAGLLFAVFGFALAWFRPGGWPGTVAILVTVPGVISGIYAGPSQRRQIKTGQ